MRAQNAEERAQHTFTTFASQSTNKNGFYFFFNHNKQK